MAQPVTALALFTTRILRLSIRSLALAALRSASKTMPPPALGLGGSLARLALAASLLACLHW